MIAPTLPKRERQRLAKHDLREGERNLPIDYNEYDFEFTERWFEDRDQVTYSTFLPERFPPHKPWRVVLVGVWEGMDGVWLLQHILNHSESFLVAIDAWKAAGKVSQERMDEVQSFAMQNIGWQPKCRIIHGMSQDVLPTLQAEHFDLAIIDGDHRAGPVYQDAVNCLRLVRPGGWIMFDDVKTHKQYLKNPLVAVGIERFLETHGDQVDFVWSHGFMACYTKRDVSVSVAGRPLA